MEGKRKWVIEGVGGREGAVEGKEGKEREREREGRDMRGKGGEREGRGRIERGRGREGTIEGVGTERGNRGRGTVRSKGRESETCRVRPAATSEAAGYIVIYNHHAVRQTNKPHGQLLRKLLRIQIYSRELSQ